MDKNLAIKSLTEPRKDRIYTIFIIFSKMSIIVLMAEHRANIGGGSGGS